MEHFQIKKRAGIFEGLNLNSNNNIASNVFGAQKTTHTANFKDTHNTSFSVPGTGISYVDAKNLNNTPNYSLTNQTDIHSYSHQDRETDYNRQNGNFDNKNDFSHVRFYRKTWFIILMLFFVSPLGLFLMWYYKEWKAPVKALISIFFIFYFMIYCALIFT